MRNRPTWNDLFDHFNRQHIEHGEDSFFNELAVKILFDYKKRIDKDSDKRCTNGHDLCFTGTIANCQYCEDLIPEEFLFNGKGN